MADACQRFARKRNLKLIALKSTNSLPATLIMSPADSAEPSGGMSLDPLLRVAELGMDVCALRSRTSSEHGGEQQDGNTSAGLMPGFIHSSPAMTRLVEEVHKIRSSDVTVLVTGESGTGKELSGPRNSCTLRTSRQNLCPLQLHRSSQGSSQKVICSAIAAERLPARLLILPG
jgi:hypothetical protein